MSVWYPILASLVTGAIWASAIFGPTDRAIERIMLALLCAAFAAGVWMSWVLT
jgi:hypothetical protein